MDEPKKEAPRPAVEGPVRRPEDIDPAGTGGPYGHTVPGTDEKPLKDRKKKKR
jgi:hypothetical protein